MKRRRFLAALALAPAAAAGCKGKRDPGGVAPAVAPPKDGCQIAAGDARRGRALAPAEWEALDAACERILPQDRDPGARAAGVINYIDAQLAYGPIRSFRPLLQAGAHELDRLAAAQGRRFGELAAQAQDQILTRVQHSPLAGGRHSGARFFEVLLALTLEGFFSDPVYGGNRGQVGWKLIGLTPRTPGARCAYPGL